MTLTLTDAAIARRKSFVKLAAEDLPRIRDVQVLVEKHCDAVVATFFAHLQSFEEAAPLFADPALLAEARALKRAHVRAMARGDYGREYVDDRLKLARLYGRVQLPVAIFLGAFHEMMAELGESIARAFSFGHFRSLKKVAFFDIALMVDALIVERDQRIELQRNAIRELSTPVLQIRDRLLIVPLIGVLDTTRADELTERTLAAIKERRARVVILDVTGVPIVDSGVAAHLERTIAAAGLTGAAVIVSGISAVIAQSLIAVGITLPVPAVGDLQDAVALAEQTLARGPARGRTAARIATTT